MKDYLFIVLLFFIFPISSSCNWAAGDDPLEENQHLYVRDITITPPRIEIVVGDYVNLDERFKTLAIYNNNGMVKDVKIEVWQKISGIGSVVYNEFRDYGQTGEVRIRGRYT